MAADSHSKAPKTPADLDGLDVVQLVRQLLREGEPAIYRKVGFAVDQAILRMVLRYTEGNQLRASELLGISRTTLRAKLRSLRLAIKKQILTESGPTE